MCDAVATTIRTNPQSLNFTGRRLLVEDTTHGHATNEVARLIACDEELPVWWRELLGG